MSFSVHFLFIEKNPPDFFFASWCVVEYELGSTDELERMVMFVILVLYLSIVESFLHLNYN